MLVNGSYDIYGLTAPSLFRRCPRLLQVSAHFLDFRRSSGHQHRLDQLGQLEPRLPAQRRGLQSLPRLLHLGLRPSYCNAGKTVPVWLIKKMEPGWFLARPTIHLASSFLSLYSSMGHCGTQQREGVFDHSELARTQAHKFSPPHPCPSFSPALPTPRLWPPPSNLRARFIFFNQHSQDWGFYFSIFLSAGVLPLTGQRTSIKTRVNGSWIWRKQQKRATHCCPLQRKLQEKRFSCKLLFASTTCQLLNLIWPHIETQAQRSIFGIP